ncbi:MAG: transcriptional regulator, partial [Thermoflexus sp.]
MLQQELGSERMMVFLASRPSEALAMLPLVAPHAILTEIAFPEDDGLQFCRRLRAAASCPIL